MDVRENSVCSMEETSVDEASFEAVAEERSKRPYFTSPGHKTNWARPAIRGSGLPAIPPRNCKHPAT